MPPLSNPMFFRPTPSKFDQAKQAARDAVSAVSGAAGSVAETVAGSAQSFLEHAPKIAAGVGDAVSAKAGVVGSAVVEKASGVGGVVAAKAATVGESLAGARDVVAAKVESVRNRAANEADDSVEAAQIKAAAARKAADLAAREAERTTRDAQKKAEAEIARAQRELAQKRADFERGQILVEERTEKLDEPRLSAQEQADELRARHKATVKIEPLAQLQAPIVGKASTHIEIPVPAHAHTNLEIQDADHDFEYQVVAEKQGGSKLWLVIGAGVFLGAALVYFFAPGSGRRSRAAIKDRLAKVKDQAVDKVTGASDAASTLALEPSQHIDSLAEATASFSQLQEAHGSVVEHAAETDEDIAQTELPLSEEVDVASSDAVEGVAVEADEPLGRIETAAGAESEVEAHHPNIFDKVAEVVGNVAGVAEHLAGEDKDGAKEKAAEIKAAAESARHESKEEREASTKKKKSK